MSKIKCDIDQISKSLNSLLSILNNFQSLDCVVARASETQPSSELKFQLNNMALKGLSTTIVYAMVELSTLFGLVVTRIICI